MHGGSEITVLVVLPTRVLSCVVVVFVRDINLRAPKSLTARQRREETFSCSVNVLLYTKNVQRQYSGLDLRWLRPFQTRRASPSLNLEATDESHFQYRESICRCLHVRPSTWIVQPMTSPICGGLCQPSRGLSLGVQDTSIWPIASNGLQSVDAHSLVCVLLWSIQDHLHTVADAESGCQAIRALELVVL